MKTALRHTALFGRLLMGGAAAIALYLAAMALGGTALPGCEAGSECQAALATPWSHAFGLPVSFAGFLVYSLSILLSWAYLRRDGTLGALVGGIALSIGVAGAVWFAVLQFFVPETACLWCALAHAFASFGALVLWSSRRRQPLPDGDHALQGLLANVRFCRLLTNLSALAAVGIVAGGASFTQDQSAAGQEVASPPAPSSGETGSDIVLFEGEMVLPAGQFPVLGSRPAGAHAGVLLVDYASSRCRQYVAALERILNGGAGPLAVAVLPASESSEAAALQRALLTVFCVDASAWEFVSRALLAGEIPPQADAVLAAAAKLLGEEKWAAAVRENTDDVASRLGLVAEVIRRLRDSGKSYPLPLLLCGSRTVTGAELNPERVRAFLRSSGGAEESGPVSEALSAGMEFDPEVALPDLQPGAAREIQIEVRNTGRAPLQLGWVSLDANCEITCLPQQQIPPGAQAVVGVRVTPPADAEGEFLRRFQFHSNAADTPGTVTLRGSLSPRVASSDLPVPAHQPY